MKSVINNKKFQKVNVLLVAGLTNNNSVSGNTQKLLNILKPLSSSITLCSPCRNLTLEDSEKIRVVRMNKNSLPVSFLTINQFIICLNIIKFKKIKQKNNIIIFAFGHDLDIFPVLLLRVLNLPLIIRSDGRNSMFINNPLNKRRIIKSFIYRLIEEINYRFSDAIITESNYMLDFYQFKKYSHSSVGNMFVDLEKFNNTKPFYSRKYNIGYIGRFSEEKGFLEFIEALMQLQKTRNFSSIIIGEGDLEKNLKSRLSNGDFDPKKNSIMPWIENEKLPEYLNDIQILVVPSYREGLPNIILEAMACGVIVLGSKVGGIPSVITHGVTGFLLDSNSSDCICDNILKIINYPNLITISEVAQKTIEEGYSLRAAQRNMCWILENILINKKE